MTAPKVDTRSDARKALDARNAELDALTRGKVVVAQRVIVQLEDGRLVRQNQTATSRDRKQRKASALERRATRKYRIRANEARP